MQRKLRVGILGGTGIVGQVFVTLLARHPWFEIAVIAASKHSAQKTYLEAVKNKWLRTKNVPTSVANLVVKDVTEIEKITNEVDFVFSALGTDKKAVSEIEEACAKTETPVVSNNSAHRWTPDVPVIIPEINPEHLDIIPAQRKRLGIQRGFIVTKPNCSIQSYVPAIQALGNFEPVNIAVCTYQAVSGAGETLESWPEIQDNVIPFICGEEEKSEKEPLKIWGVIKKGRIVNAKLPTISAQCVRVPITDGHLAAVFVQFLATKPTKEQIIEKWREFKGEPQKLKLPSAPIPFITYLEANSRPQTNLDRDRGCGMGITTGRLREDNIFDYKFVCLSHNLVRGAAGGAILTAELLKTQGYLEEK